MNASHQSETRLDVQRPRAPASPSTARRCPPAPFTRSKRDRGVSEGSSARRGCRQTPRTCSRLRNSRVAPRAAKGSSVCARDGLVARPSRCAGVAGHQRRVSCKKKRHSFDDGPGTSRSEIIFAGFITATNVSLYFFLKSCLSLPFVTHLCSISVSNTSGLTGSCRSALRTYS